LVSAAPFDTADNVMLSLVCLRRPNQHFYLFFIFFGALKLVRARFVSSKVIKPDIIEQKSEHRIKKRLTYVGWSTHLTKKTFIPPRESVGNNKRLKAP
jgi:hypothetical protein